MATTKTVKNASARRPSKARRSAPKSITKSTKNDLCTKVVSLFDKMTKSGKSQTDAIKKAMEQFGITYPNAYYYWNRVYKAAA